ncbi:MAG: hypothetical protein CM1200mP30_19840 [Pseudomonadota bacterium]|nr:MAG: hypothetical protein CM1200mP30_19840 [Pseudomonadota bacterium]
MWTFGNVLIAFGILALNGSLQEQQKDGLLALGSFLFIVGQIGFMIATPMDVAIIYAQDPIKTRKHSIKANECIFYVWSSCIFRWCFSFTKPCKREYINPLYARITAVVFLIVILAFFYSPINMAIPGIITFHPRLCRLLQESVLLNFLK